jgi:hypothetical protein
LAEIPAAPVIYARPAAYCNAKRTASASNAKPVVAAYPGLFGSSGKSLLNPLYCTYINDKSALLIFDKFCYSEENKWIHHSEVPYWVGKISD